MKSGIQSIWAKKGLQIDKKMIAPGRKIGQPGAKNMEPQIKKRMGSVENMKSKSREKCVAGGIEVCRGCGPCWLPCSEPRVLKNVFYFWISWLPRIFWAPWGQ